MPIRFLLLASVLLSGLMSPLPARAAGGGDRVALLPLAAEGVALDEMSELERLDAALRKGLAALPDVRVQPREDTLAHVAGARDVGLSCRLDDGRCLGKLAVLAEVDAVFAASASLSGDAFDVELRLVERGGDEKVTSVSLPRDPASLPTAAGVAVRVLWQTRSSHAETAAVNVAPPAETPAAETPAAETPAAETPAAETPPAEPPPGSSPPPAAEPPPADAAGSASEDDGGGALWLGLGVGVAAVAVVAVVAAGAVAVALVVAPPPPAGPAVVVLE